MIAFEIQAYIEQALGPLRADIVDIRDESPHGMPQTIDVPSVRHHDQPPSPPPIFRATADATWSGTYSRWEVATVRVDTAGTTGTPETSICVGASGDSVPVLEGMLCVAVTSRDNRRVVVPMDAVVATDDISINLNTEDELQIYGWETGLPLSDTSIAQILMGV